MASVMAAQGIVNSSYGKAFTVLVEHTGPLLKGHAGRAVAAVIDIVARGLVRQQVDVEVPCHRRFQQIYDVAVVGDGNALPLLPAFPKPMRKSSSMSSHYHARPSPDRGGS